MVRIGKSIPHIRVNKLESKLTNSGRMVVMAVRTNDVTQISSEFISTPIPTVYWLSTILNEARERKVISTTISLAAGSGLLVWDSRKREVNTCINMHRL